MRVTISCRYATMHCPSWQHHAFEGCIVRTSIAFPFTGRFQQDFQRVFHKRLLFQMHYIVLIFVARWRSKIAKSPKIGRKVCAHHSCCTTMTTVDMNGYRDTECEVLFEWNMNGMIMVGLVQQQKSKKHEFIFQT